MTETTYEYKIWLAIARLERQSSTYEERIEAADSLRKMISKPYSTIPEDIAKDAARYRWLRHGDNDERVMNVHLTNVFLPRNKILDEMIDKCILEDIETDKHTVKYDGEEDC